MQDRARGGSTELERRLDGEREVREGGGRGKKRRRRRSREEQGAMDETKQTEQGKEKKGKQNEMVEVNSHSAP